MSSKLVLTATAVVLGIVGIAWSLFPATFVGFWRIEPGTNATYLGNRMGTLLFGLAVTSWLGRKAANTEARRALMLGALVALVLMTAQSLYGAVALGYMTWMPTIGEGLLTLGFVWVLFVRPEPIVPTKEMLR